MMPRLALPPSRAVLLLLAIAFVLPGLAAHDPWKSVDAVTIEIAHGMLASGDWLVPRVAGEPWLETPPLYHWLAAASGAALGGLLPFHNAARLASGLCMLAAFWFVYLAARHSGYRGEDARQSARGAAACAMLLLAGSVGLIVRAHEAAPELAALAATCAGFLFLARAVRRPVAAGVGFGAAVAAALLSTGLTVPFVLLAAALAAQLRCAELRGARALRFLLPALALPALAAAAWYAALGLRSPELAASAWKELLRARGEFGPALREHLVTASWYAWPAWPLALWAAWALRREWRTVRVFVPAVAALAALVAIAWKGTTHDLHATPLLAPLALLGAQGIAQLRRGAAAALDWFGVMTFGFFTALVWLGYLAMTTGWPPRIARNFAKTAPGFVAQFDALAFAIAVVLALGWLWIVLFAASSPARAVVRWAAGVVLLWGTFAMLWMPWADYQKSYRGVALQLRSLLPAAPGCISGTGLGLPQRAALSYHAGIRTVAPSPQCRFHLVQGRPRMETAPGPGWSKIADVGRPGDKSERYRLYRRD